MNEIVSKFLDFLENEIEKLKDKVLQNATSKKMTTIPKEDEATLEEMAEMKRVIRLLSVPKEEWENYAEVYIDLNILERLLNNSHLKLREQLHIIFTMLEKNLATPILSEEVGGFDAPKIEDYKFKSMTTKEARDLIHSQEYGRLASTNIEELSEEEKTKYEEIKEFIDSNPLDLSYIQELHRNIYMHYFEKKDSYDYEDVNAILYVLSSFGISDDFIDRIKIVLTKEVKKREPKKEVTIEVSNFHHKQEENRLSKKEYNILDRELRKYFDLVNMKSIQPLNIRLQIYCVSLMIKMNYNIDTIKKVLRVMNKDFRMVEKLENPISLFVQLYDKMIYYKDNEEIQNAVSQLFEYFQETIICSDSDYEFWKNMISEELDNINDLLPDTYEYEIESARVLAKR